MKPALYWTNVFNVMKKRNLTLQKSLRDAYNFLRISNNGVSECGSVSFVRAQENVESQWTGNPAG
jgi:hypothetical protein